MLGSALLVQLLVAAPSTAAATCSTFTGVASGTPYTATVCLDTPGVGATLTGTTALTASVTVDPASLLVDRMVFWWGQIATPTPAPTYLLADHDAPYRMVLDTTRFPNGSNVFSVRPVFVGGAVTSGRVGGAFTVDNPPSPPDGRSFAPWTGDPPGPGERFRLAAVGDGVDGSPESHAVVDVLTAAQPDAFAYLGDVYDRGTAQEFDTWYEEPDGFGSLRGITNPTVGNHEYMLSPTAAPYFAFWDEVPHYYSYDVGGWHVIVLDSTVEFGQLGVNSAQYQWLVADLAADDSDCTMMYAHHARYSNVIGVNRGGLQAVWELLTDRGVDLILAGHAHTYERWTPLDRDGVPAVEGITQFVVGTGGRPILNPKGTEPRVVTEATTPGALALDLGEADANFTFTSADGAYTDSGTVPCRTPPEVTPTVDSALPGDDGWHRGDVALTWEATDAESPVTTAGCEPTSVTADQPATQYTCTASSGGGVTSRTVTVKRDATPPLVTAAIEPVSPDGANDWFVTRPTVRIACGDALSGVATCPDPVQPDEGISSVVRTGRDVAGNSSEVTFGPVRVDLTDPAVTCDPAPTFLLRQAGTAVAGAVSDGTSGPLRGTEIVPVTTTAVGDQTAPVTGTDLAGRSSTVDCGFRVVYGFSGWAPPLAPDVVNVVKAGRSLPLKWQLADAGGVPVTDVDSAQVSTVPHACGGSSPEDPVEEVTPAGGSGLQNFGDGSYQYNWKTPKSWSGSCRTVRLDLGDDLLRTLEFRFTA